MISDLFLLFCRSFAAITCKQTEAKSSKVQVNNAQLMNLVVNLYIKELCCIEI